MKRHKTGTQKKPRSRSTQVPAIIAHDDPAKSGTALADAPGTIVGFNYATLPPDVAKSAKLAAIRIKSALNENLIEIGSDLRAMKKKLLHGQFGAWIRAEFGLAERTAQRYMAAARLAAKSDTVSDLAPTALYTLASPTTPTSVRDKVIKRLAAGQSFGAREIKGLIRQAKTAGGDRPTSKVASQSKKAIKRDPRDSSNPPIRFTEVTGPIIRKRLSPVDRKVFWARIRHKGDYLLVVDVRAEIE